MEPISSLVRYSLGINGYQFKDAFNDYQQIVEGKLGFECLPQAGMRNVAPVDGTVVNGV